MATRLQRGDTHCPTNTSVNTAPAVTRQVISVVIASNGMRETKREDMAILSTGKAPPVQPRTDHRQPG